MDGWVDSEPACLIPTDGLSSGAFDKRLILMRSQSHTVMREIATQPAASPLGAP